MKKRIENLFPSLDPLINVFRSYPEIGAVYLFGSVARGNANFRIDLDHRPRVQRFVNP